MRVAILAPIDTQLMARLVAWGVHRSADIELVGVLVRTPWTKQRILSELKRDGSKVPMKVYTKLILRDRPATTADSQAARLVSEGVPGRGLAELCAQIGVPLTVVKDFDDPDGVAALQAARPDAIAFCGGGLVRPAVLALPEHGVLNVHAGVLPRYRGMNVVEWPLAERRTDTGLTLHRMDKGIDTGPIVRVEPMPPQPGETFADLRHRMGASMPGIMVRGLEGIARGELTPQPQQKRDGRQYYPMHPRLLAWAERRLSEDVG